MKRTDAQVAESLVWASAAAIILVSLLVAPPDTARAATIGALLCAANFSFGRIAINRILLGGEGQRTFTVLFATKFALTVAGLGFLTLVMKLDVFGLIIGFSALPLAMYLLLFVMLIKKRTNKTE